MRVEHTDKAIGEELLEPTQSVCPECRTTLPAELISREGKVVLHKRCDLHGSFEALIYGDVARYRAIQRYRKPGARPLELQTETLEGCPRECGICPAHEQHSCLGVIEVNTACNLDCPVCLADSGTGPEHHGAGGFSLTLEQVESMLDSFAAAESTASMRCAIRCREDGAMCGVPRARAVRAGDAYKGQPVTPSASQVAPDTPLPLPTQIRHGGRSLGVEGRSARDVSVSVSSCVAAIAVASGLAAAAQTEERGAASRRCAASAKPLEGIQKRRAKDPFADKQADQVQVRRGQIQRLR